MNKPYTPPKKILENYAKVLINFALGGGLKGGAGIRKGDIVLVRAPEVSKPLYLEILKTIWKAGGHVIGRFSPDSERWFPVDRTFYEIASNEQLKFFPSKLLKAQVEIIDHSLAIIAETNPKSLQGIDPKKLMMSQEANKPYKKWFFEKENKGKLTWTLCLYGTRAMAKEAKMSEREYWNQIVKACFLDKNNPIRHWRGIFIKLEEYKKKLNNLNIEKFMLKAQMLICG